MQKTKYIFTLLLLCACAFAYAAKFKVSVEVCVGLRTEDKFYFEMDEGEIQQKGYDGKMLVATNDCWLNLDCIQLSGKKRMDAKAFINGFRELENHKLVY